MDQKQFENEYRYQYAVLFFKSMFEKGVITDEDYKALEDNIRKRISPLIPNITHYSS